MSKNTTQDWREIMAKSEAARVKGDKFKKQAGTLLWDGALGAIEAWDSDADSDANGLYNEVMEALGGNHRKGDASKIATVARATVSDSLDVTQFPNLAKAYAEARRLTKTAKAERDEDDTADEVTGSIEAPKTASAPDSAAKILLAKGVDGAVVAIFDELAKAAGGDVAKAEAAIRSFVRSAATEATARVKARTDGEKAERMAANKAAAEAKIEERKKAQAEKEAARKAVAKEKGKGAKPAKAKPAKAAPAAPKAKPAPAAKVAPPKAETPETEAAPAKAAPVKRAAPARRAAPVRRPAK